MSKRHQPVSVRPAFLGRCWQLASKAPTCHQATSPFPFLYFLHLDKGICLWDFWTNSKSWHGRGHSQREPQRSFHSHHPLGLQMAFSQSSSTTKHLGFHAALGWSFYQIPAGEADGGCFYIKSTHKGLGGGGCLRQALWCHQLLPRKAKNRQNQTTTTTTTTTQKGNKLPHHIKFFKASLKGKVRFSLNGRLGEQGLPPALPQPPQAHPSPPIPQLDPEQDGRFVTADVWPVRMKGAFH